MPDLELAAVCRSYAAVEAEVCAVDLELAVTAVDLPLLGAGAVALVDWRVSRAPRDGSGRIEWGVIWGVGGLTLDGGAVDVDCACDVEAEVLVAVGVD